MDTRLCPGGDGCSYFSCICLGCFCGLGREGCNSGAGIVGGFAKLWKAFHCLDKVLVFLSTDENGSYPDKFCFVQVQIVYTLKTFLLHAQTW